MRYGQMRNRLVRCIGTLHVANARDRQKMMRELKDEQTLEDSDDSPSNGYGVHETAFKVETYKQIHDALVKLMECATMDQVKELMDVFAEAFAEPPPDDSSSDESMDAAETASQRLLRYQNAEQAEVSDPDEWADVHYGPPAAREAGMMEF